MYSSIFLIFELFDDYGTIFEKVVSGALFSSPLFKWGEGYVTCAVFLSGLEVPAAQPLQGADVILPRA